MKEVNAMNETLREFNDFVATLTDKEIDTLYEEFEGLFDTVSEKSSWNIGEYYRQQLEILAAEKKRRGTY